jgi:RNA polymerase sigma-70 factor (ECF subfamily)
MTLRKKKVHAVGIEELANEVEDEADLTKQKNLDKQLEQMLSFMNSLSANQRLCIELFYFKKMSYQQIAKEQKLSVKDVKSLLQNGKRNLKTMMLSIK